MATTFVNRETVKAELANLRPFRNHSKTFYARWEISCPRPGRLSDADFAKLKAEFVYGEVPSGREVYVVYSYATPIAWVAAGPDYDVQTEERNIDHCHYHRSKYDVTIGDLAYGSHTTTEHQNQARKWLCNNEVNFTEDEWATRDRLFRENV
jgi:hypothetical protein